MVTIAFRDQNPSFLVPQSSIIPVKNFRMEMSESLANQNFQVCGEKNERSHIGLLPVELLIKIFILAVPQIDAFDPKTPICTITRVCSYWRAVALREPRLWTNIDISTLRHVTPKRLTLPHRVSVSEMLSAFIHYCYSNSGNLPLQLSLPTHCPNSDDIALFNLLDIDNVLATHTTRWEHLKLSTIVCRSFFNPGHLPQITFPCLRSLELHGTYGLHGAPSSSFYAPNSLFTNSPILTHLSLYTIKLPIQLNNLNLPSLTHLTADECFFAPDLLTDLLRGVPNLVELSWISSTAGMISSDGRTVIRMNSLRTLQLSLPHESLGGYLDKIEAPFLQRLELNGYNGRYSLPMGNSQKAIVSLHRRSRCSIHYLSLRSFSAKAVIHILREYGEVKAFSLGPDTPGVLDVIRLLKRSKGHQYLLPNIEELTMDVAVGRNLPAIFEMVRSRLSSMESKGTTEIAAHLHRFVLRLIHKPNGEDEVISALQELRSDKTNLTIVEDVMDKHSGWRCELSWW